VFIEKIDPYPWFISKPMRLMVNERPVETKISPTEWSEWWRPLMARILEAYEGKPNRLMIAIVGNPGSGKSVLAEQLNWMIYRGVIGKEVRPMALQMDGFHYSNEYLEHHYRELSEGSKIPLAWVKGQPDTIDVDAMRARLTELRAMAENVSWPGYSRVTHEPVPNASKVHVSTNVVIVDGNYLLSDRPPFTGIKDFFDVRIYIEVPTAKILSNLMDRQLKNGKSVDEAKAWIKRVDLPNAKLVEASKVNANVILAKSMEDEVTGILWNGESLADSYRRVGS
jgi:pantothenate kinase